ncbi:MAG: flippase-like domain-containing protein [Candidatus Omnitrophica bacterium]|nr:flippase-like domain-containing protein [Candidatus Omnitrophota bacterium]
MRELICLIYGVIFALDTWGWHFSFPKNITYAFRWRSLFGSRLAGEAINYVTPFAALGGEPVKAQILKDRHQVSWSDGLASVIVAKTSLTFGLLPLILSGLGVALWNSPLSQRLKLATLGMTLFLTLLISLFFYLQHGGLANRSWLALKKWIPLAWIEKTSNFAGRRTDQSLTGFYRNHRRRFLLSILFHFLGWALGIVEIYLIMRFLHIEISWGQAWILESLLQLVKALSFLIPAALGTQEGGALLLCTGLGLGSASGISLALVRRFRELVWAGVGLLLWVWLMRPKIAR